LKNKKRPDNNLKAPKLCQIVQHPKVHLEFLLKAPILEILKYKRVCI